ncbi:MAG: hypothetical protein ABIR91_00405 [Candidatus Saccharimonadales bacterium]
MALCPVHHGEGGGTYADVSEEGATIATGIAITSNATSAVSPKTVPDEFMLLSGKNVVWRKLDAANDAVMTAQLCASKATPRDLRRYWNTASTTAIAAVTARSTVVNMAIHSEVRFMRSSCYVGGG